MTFIEILGALIVGIIIGILIGNIHASFIVTKEFEIKNTWGSSWNSILKDVRDKCSVK
jgi:hypothetical protein